MSKHRSTPEQRARDLLDRLPFGLPDAQSLTSGDVVELANLLASHDDLVIACNNLIRVLDLIRDVGVGAVNWAEDVVAARATLAKTKEKP